VSTPFKSKGRYDPLVGLSLPAAVVATVVAGRVVYGPRIT
jgi:dihydroorotase-like cyclic amidohydrolase